MGLTTLQRWRRQYGGDGDGVDRRKGSLCHVVHRLSEEERQHILLAWNEHEFAALPPGQIVPVLADVVSRACLRERISRAQSQPLILHADNGNAMRAATLESRLEELGVRSSFSRQRVSNDNPYSESLFRTAKYRPDYPSRPFTSMVTTCQWVQAFVNWYNHRQRHSGIKFVRPHQRHNGDVVEICGHRVVVYEQARQRHPRRWSRSVQCWRQPEVVWINPPPPEIELDPAKLWVAA